ncbi:hypothetical protein, partial [Streptomyces sp. NPDC058621]|uniref:hypothetical protein n=1 Tax=Streptomyces sp. NPDC058621 TaxID=3346561 RepID=UPI00364E6618
TTAHLPAKISYTTQRDTIDSGAMVVTNDNFAELQGRYPWLREKGGVLGATCATCATCAKGAWFFTDRTCVAPRGRG